MSVLPEYSALEVTSSPDIPSKTYAIDFKRGRIIGFTDELEAVKQAIVKAIITPRFKCAIYDDQYGSEIWDAVHSDDATREYIESVTEGFVKDALSVDNRITDVYDFSIEFGTENAVIRFTVDTIYGTTTIEEDV